MVTYLFSRWGLGTLLMLLVGSYFLGRYYIKRRTGNVQWRDLLWGLILTVWGLIMTVWMPHYSWDAFAMYAGIFAGFVGLGKLIWDGCLVVFSSRDRKTRDFIASGTLILTGICNVFLFLNSIALAYP